ncbi:hypothetical protein BGZ47_004735 [Haplosporangium gracile]|nr:hypothetical protein BGZ47_004735 [Haplosporangium gracile]
MIEGRMNAHQLRSIFTAFSALEDISMPQYGSDDTLETEQWDELEYHSLRKFSTRYPSIFFGMKDTPDPAAPAYGLTDLIFTGEPPSRQGRTRINTLILRLLHLIRLKLGLIDTSVLKTITATCRGLVYAKFGLDFGDAYFRGLYRFFAKCSHLKECLRPGHVVLAENIINGPEWSFQGLQKLNIEILVPCQTSLDHVQLLGRVRRADGSTMTPEEMVSLEEHEKSDVIQRQIHTTLRWFKDLMEVNFGPRSDLPGKSQQ